MDRSSHWLLLAGLLLLPILAGCHRQLEVHDDFEASELSKVWATDRFAPGAVQIQAEVVRRGHRAARITVRQDDLHEGVDPLQSRPTERAELREQSRFAEFEGDSYAYAFSIYLPKDFPIVPTRLVLAQWKQYARGGPLKSDSPPIALRYMRGELRITVQDGPKEVMIYHQPRDLRGQWLDFEFHIRFARTDAGRVQAWLNGQMLCDYRGPTAYGEEIGYPAGGRFYFKMGLYRDRMAAPMTAYFDEYSRRPLSAAELP